METDFSHFIILPIIFTAQRILGKSDELYLIQTRIKGECSQEEHGSHGAGAAVSLEWERVEMWSSKRLSDLKNSAGKGETLLSFKMKLSQQGQTGGPVGETRAHSLVILCEIKSNAQHSLGIKMCAEVAEAPLWKVCPFCFEKGLATCAELWKQLSLETFQSPDGHRHLKLASQSHVAMQKKELKWEW